MGELGSKIISGKMISLDDEKVENLKELSKDLKIEEGNIKEKIDVMIK